MNRCWKVIKEAYITLKKHEDYWLFDNDYKRKYEYIREAATTETNFTNRTVESIATIAEFMLEANSRIFA